MNMEESIRIKDFKVGDTITSVFFLKQGGIKVAKNGSTYFDGIITDNSSSLQVPIKFWDVNSDFGNTIEQGNLCWLRMLIEEYNGSLQGRLSLLKQLNQDGLKPENWQAAVRMCVPTAPIDIEETWQFVQDTINTIQDENIKTLVVKVIDELGIENYKWCAAALSHHHFERGGILWHVSEMLKIAAGIMPLYPNINRDIINASIILHDCEKIHEMNFSKLNLATEYSAQGNLLGHLCLGVMIVDRIGRSINMDETTLLHIEHCIASHHQKLEWGAIKLSATPESLLVAECDNISARMYQYVHIQETVEPGEFSDMIRSLDGVRIWNPRKFVK